MPSTDLIHTCGQAVEYASICPKFKDFWMQDLWEKTQNELRGRLSEENFETWLSPVRFESLKDDVVRLVAPNRFHAEWVEAHYGKVIVEHFQSKLERTGLRIAFDVDRSLQEQRQPTSPGSIPAPRASSPGSIPAPRQSSAGSISSPIRVESAQPSADANRVADLNPKYTFDNFVVGPSNQLAHAAAVAASHMHGKRGNPFFIYGGTGLGKTHLVNAIGHAAMQQRPGVRVLYLSAERFTNEFISAIQNHRMEEFRKRYRVECDVLLMDDIQFLAGREQTQEEFFHTFNALYHADKQIVVTSDVYPDTIPEMQERLISRFQWGLVADIQAPELDTRIAILKRKAAEESIVLTDDVALFLAQTAKSNVRELEGALLRLAVAADLTRRAIDLDFARSQLRVPSTHHDQAMSVGDIQTAVCGYFKIRIADLKSQRRHRAISHPRMVAMYLCRQRLGTSYPLLGEAFGGKDHTTVLSAVRKIDGMVSNHDPKICGEIEAIERKLGF